MVSKVVLGMTTSLQVMSIIVLGVIDTSAVGSRHTYTTHRSGLIVSARVDHISQRAETPLTWFKDQKWIHNAEKPIFTFCLYKIGHCQE